MGTFRHSHRHPPCGGPIRPVYSSEDSFNRKADHKTAALCKQVLRAVSMALSGECADPVLQELLVAEVLPAPGAGRLLVRVMLRARENGPAVTDVLQRLERVQGLLRSSVGAAIVRKRTPELAFEVIPMGLPPAAKAYADGDAAGESPAEAGGAS